MSNVFLKLAEDLLYFRLPVLEASGACKNGIRQNRQSVGFAGNYRLPSKEKSRMQSQADTRSETHTYRISADGVPCSSISRRIYDGR